MHRVCRWFLRLLPVLAAVLLAGLLSCACAEEAPEITGRCRITPGSNPRTFSRCTDRDYETYWSSVNGDKACIEIEAPEGETLSGVWIQWYDHPHAWSVQVRDEVGEWQDCGLAEGLYLSDYLEVPEGTTALKVANRSKKKARMLIAELHVYGAGDRAAEAQVWEPPAEKADLMLLVAHPDDEVLWFGGALPTYAGERGKTCQVCMMVPTMPYRRLELLDCLWTCGVKNYPVWGPFRDSFSYTLSRQYKHWNKNQVYSLVTGWIRQFRPDVLLTHDFAGEYGHGAHRVCADAAAHCLALAENEKKYPASAKEYGTWAVPKCYIHLYGENVVDMDWRQPLSAFGGRTSFEVAEDGFRCHISQQKTDYKVEDFGPWDNSLFGLYRSLVGEDVRKDDFFENLE